LHQVGTSSLLIYMMHGHTYIKLLMRLAFVENNGLFCDRCPVYRHFGWESGCV